MSRQEVTSGAKVFAFGADHVTGSFCQYWSDAENDAPAITIDNMGVTVRIDERTLPLGVRSFLVVLRCRFTFAREQGNPRPNIDVQAISQLARLLGFEIPEADIYRALD